MEQSETKRMKVKEAMSGTLPRWLTPILLAICIYYLNRQVVQQDAIAALVRDNTTSIAVLNAAAKSTTDSLDRLKEITRILETRLVRLETKEESRKP